MASLYTKGLLEACLTWNVFQMEGLYKKCHELIRANPARKVIKKKEHPKKRWTDKKLTHEQRKAKIAKAKADFLKKIEAGEVE